MIGRRTSAFGTARAAAQAAGTVLSGAVVMATVLVACSVSSEETFRPIKGTDIPFELGVRTSTTSTTAAPTTIARSVPESTTTTAPRPTTPPTTIPTRDIPLFFIRSGRLVQVMRHGPALGLTTSIDPEQLQRQLEIGPLPSDSPSGFGLGNAVQAGQVKTITIKRGSAEVTITQAFLQLQGGQQNLAIAQLVYTLTSQPGTGSVRFLLLDGSPTPVPSPKDGSSLTGPLAQEDFPASIKPDLGATATTSTSAATTASTKPIPDDGARTSPTSATTTTPSPSPSPAPSSSIATATSG